MSQCAGHPRRAELKFLEKKGFWVLRVHDVTSTVVDTSCNNIAQVLHAQVRFPVR